MFRYICIEYYRKKKKRQHHLKERKTKKEQFHDFAKLRKTELIRLEPLFFKKPIEPLITDRCCCCCG
jgi:hypothetical protein